MKDIIEQLKGFHVSRLIRMFIFADFMVWGGWGIVSPILAVFILQHVVEATIVTVGITSSVYWIVKSIVQIPVAVYIDRHVGEREDFHALILGLILGGFAALAFPLVGTPMALYAVTALQGVAFAFYIPSWSAIFSRHLDKEHYALDWSLDSTGVGIAAGVAALLGGGFAELFGFPILFILTACFSFGSAILLFFVPNILLPPPISHQSLHRDPTPVGLNK